MSHYYSIQVKVGSTARGIPYIEVLQLGFRRGLLHKLQNSA